MESTRNSTVPSLWTLFVTSIPRAPWRGYFFGLFLPLIVLQAGGLLEHTMFGATAALGLCIAFFAIDTRRTKQLCVFPMITFFMISTQVAAGIAAAKHPEWAEALAYVPIADNGVIALAFLLSLGTQMPLILAMLDPETRESIPEKIRRSSYHLTGWRLVTLLWGILYIIQPCVLMFFHVHSSPTAAIVEYLFGWPMVAVFLVFSVMLPRWYWIGHMRQIETEVK